MVYELNDTTKVKHLFDGWQETLIWSCLQGVMGKIYVIDLDCPESAAAWLGDFCFFAGKPEEELVTFWDFKTPEGLLMVPENEDWSQVITGGYGKRASRVTRYAIKKEGDLFDREKLQAAVQALPEGYTLHLIDEPLYEQCLREPWSRDLVSQFGSYERYADLGLGVAALKDGTVVSGASSYTRYEGGIEIEIDTREDHRRKGLAFACGARLIMECLARGLYPSWDAQNLWSVALAEKLGYHFSHEYTTYEVHWKLKGEKE